MFASKGFNKAGGLVMLKRFTEGLYSLLSNNYRHSTSTRNSHIRDAWLEVNTESSSVSGV